jgi:hypothetical protein
VQQDCGEAAAMTVPEFVRVPLPESSRTFVASQVKQLGMASASAFILDLIAKEKSKGSDSTL